MNFNNLKKNGYVFWKAYAANYKVYTKEVILYSKKFNVWVAHGGYLEIGDLYQNTYQIIETIRGIDWAKYSDKKFLYIRFNHHDIGNKIGCLISEESFTISSILLQQEGLTIDEANDKVREKYDREFVVTQKKCEEIIKEVDYLVSQGLKI